MIYDIYIYIYIYIGNKLSRRSALRVLAPGEERGGAPVLGGAVDLKHMCVYMCMYVRMCIYIYIYMYTYIERDR